MAWPKEKVEQLISIYEANPILWDKKCSEYKNRCRRKNVLQTMADKFDCSFEEIKRKLHNLRNQMSQEIKKCRKKNSGSAEEVYTSGWPYFSALKFLLPSLSVTPSAQEFRDESLIEHSGNEDDVNDAYIQIVKQELEVEEDSAFSSISFHSDPKTVDPLSTPEPTRKRRMEDDVNPVGGKIQRRSDDIFGEYMVAQLKELKNPKVKADAIFKISQILHEATVNDL